MELMNNNQLEYIFNQFKHNAVFDSVQELVSGHINDTYLIQTTNKPYYILQKINHTVFKDVPGLVSNKVLISQHLQHKLKHLPKNELFRRVLSFISSKTENFYFKNDDGCYWNLMRYIDDGITFETVNSAHIAYEAGKLFGDFLNLTSDFELPKLTTVIPKFHDMSFRYSQFEEALQKASQKRLELAKNQILLVQELKEEMHILQRLKESGDIRLRVTHNDTKVSNALFTQGNKGLCVIDTDTIMPGIIHYDFGDAIRSICNTSEEDEINLDLVNFNVSYYKAYTKGFLEQIGDSLSEIETKYLLLGAKSMIFIMAIRFLTDYLNNDIYYKTKYLEHNLNRSKNQLKLLQSLTNQEKELA